MLIDLIADKRSTFIKIAPVIYAIRQEQQKGYDILFRIVYTGKVDDSFISFLEQLNLQKPHYSLGIQEGTETEQAALLMTSYEQIIADKKPDFVFVTGNTVAAMACAITAKKHKQILVMHYDAGLRADPASVDEVNGILVDAVTDYYFTTSHNANENLRITGIPEEQIFLTGNTIADTIIEWQEHFAKPRLWEKLQLRPQEYFVLRLHSRALMLNPEKLKAILVPIIQSSKGMPVVFTIDAGDVEIAKEIGMRATNLFLTQPMNYFHFNYLIQNALAVITDADTVQMETTLMAVPCMTLQDYCLHPETCFYGSNELIGTEERTIYAAFKLLHSGKWNKGNPPYMWDGNAAERIVTTLKQLN